MAILKRHSASSANAPVRKAAKKSAASRSPTQLPSTRLAVVGTKAAAATKKTTTSRSAPTSPARSTRRSASKTKTLQLEEQATPMADTEQPQQPQPQPQQPAAPQPSSASPAPSSLDSDASRSHSAASTSSALSASSQATTPASSEPSPAVEAAPTASSPSPAPAYSAEELKMLSTISSVTDRIAQLEREVPTLRAQIAHHMSRIALLHWCKKYRSPTLNAHAVHMSHKRLHYAAGAIDENVMQAIFRLDTIQTDNSAIRATRKATVARANQLIADSIQLRDKMERWKKWLPEEPKQEEAKPETKPEPVAQPAVQPALKAAAAKPALKAAASPAAVVEPTAAPMVESSQANEEEAAMMEDEKDDGEEDEKMEQKYPEPAVVAAPPQLRRSSPSPKPAAPAKSSPAPKPATPALTPLQRKYAHLNLPTYGGPSFHSRVHPLTGSLLIESDMSGVLAEDVSVSTEPATRSLIIRGVKLPQRRRSMPSHPFGGLFGMPQRLPVEPHGFFTKTIPFAEIDPTESLNLAAMSAVLNADDRLEITIPRQAPKKAAQPPPVHAAPRQPVHHSTRALYSDDEEDDAPDAYSHPYSSYYRPQPRPRAVPHPFYAPQPAYYSQPSYARPSPFGSWW